MAPINILIKKLLPTFANINVCRISLSTTLPSCSKSKYYQSLWFRISTKPSFHHHLTCEWKSQKCSWLFEPREQLSSMKFPTKKQDICLMTGSSLLAASPAALSSVHLSKWALFHPREGPQQLWWVPDTQGGEGSSMCWEGVQSTAVGEHWQNTSLCKAWPYHFSVMRLGNHLFILWLHFFVCETERTIISRTHYSTW